MRRLWQAAATVDSILESASHPSLLEQAVECGLRSLFVGFESISEANLRAHGKRQNRRAAYERAVERLHSLGVMINASFVFGMDEDGPGVFGRTVEWAVTRGLETATFHILTPYPGTALHARLEAQGRILHRNWDLYDTRHAVFQPARMSPTELEAGYWRAYRDFYRWSSIARAVSRWPAPPWKRCWTLLRAGASHILAARMRPLLLLALCASSILAADDFVPVRSGELRPGIAVDSFEMLSHPVTNAEYALFVAAAKHPAPPHWNGPQPPAAMAALPVVFVNRMDVEAYLRWRSAAEKRVYRLPSRAEWEYAARAGGSGRYPWGEDEPANHANFDAQGTRTFAQWRQFLKPVRQFPPNAFGLYDMAGNVWQMVDSYPDPATARFVYRIERPVERENGLAGGSWARSEYYLRCGVFGGASAGIRHPDIGFRPVREPLASTHFRRLPRRVTAAVAASGRVYLSWQQLAGEGAASYHVYRATRRDSAGIRISAVPISKTTDFTDPAPPPAERVYYRVRAVDAGGQEGPPSEWAGLDPRGPASNLIAVFEPAVRQGGFVPVFGDLDGDGVLDAVLRLDNGIKEMSRDPGVPIELEGFTSYGRSLWRRPLVFHDHCFGNANNVPVVLYDLDGDGKSEVISQIQEGDTLYLAVLDGMTGRTLRKTPWTKPVSDFAKSSTRVHLSIAYLDGKRPAIVTQTGLYENEIFDAFDASLRKLWTFRSFGETSGSGSHHIDVADVDGDGRDEVFDGTTLLNPDGTVRWSIYREHPDIVAVKHILGNASRQVYYAVESSVHAGAYVVDASTGKLHWKLNREDDPRWSHAHIGWAARIWDGAPGYQMLTNRDGHEANDSVLFDSTGKILMNPFPKGWRPVNWSGGEVRDLVSGDGRRLARFTGRAVEEMRGAVPAPLPGLNCSMGADLAGDYRDELVCDGRTPEGNPAVFVFTNTAPAAQRAVTRTASREYRLWLARNRGGGYASYFEWEP